MTKWLLLTGVALLLLVGCGGTANEEVFRSYWSIPGVTVEEIEAVESLRQRFDYFTVGMLYGNDAFTDSQGNMRGFSTHFNAWLTELFGIPFIPTHFLWSEIVYGLGAGDVHFTADMAPVAPWSQTHYMTDPIAHRMFMYYRLAGSPCLTEIAQERLPRYLLQVDSTMASLITLYAGERFEAIFVSSFEQAYAMLLSGYADALVAESSLAAYWLRFPYIETSYFIPIIYAPVTLAARNTDFAPIIRIVQLALESGADVYLSELYDRGQEEFRRHILFNQLTAEEIAFLNTNPVVRLGARYNNYPTVFYNARNNTWEGISFDILAEVEALTGLRFEIPHEPGVSAGELVNQLEAGELDMVAQVLRTPYLEERILFPEFHFMNERMVLISRIETPNVQVARMHSKRIGLLEDVGHVEIFNDWFPNHGNTVYFLYRYDAFEALQNGEIDLVFNSHSSLLYYTHYHETTDFKVNLIFGDNFNDNIETNFGLHESQEILRSILDKSLTLIDINTIYVQWRYRTYDYRMQLLQTVIPLMIMVAVLALIIIFLLTIMYMRKRSMMTQLNDMVEERTEELEGSNALLTTLFDAIPDIIFIKDMNLKLTHANQAFLKNFKLDPDNIKNKDEDDLGFSEEMAAHLSEVDREVISTGKTIIAEDAHPHTDWSDALYETIKAPLLQKGKIIGLVGIARDVTARRALEQAIEESYEYSKMLGESLATITKSPAVYDEDVYAAMAVIASEAAQVLDVQRVSVWEIRRDMSAMDNLFFYDREEERQLILDYVYELTSERYFRMIQDLRLVVVDDMSDYDGENKDYDDGTCAILEAPIRMDGTLFGIISFEQKSSEKHPTSRQWTLEEQHYVSSLGDIMALVISGDERRKAREAAEHANHAKSVFLANMSHEIRTPMNSVIGFSELALDDDVSTRTRDYLNKIKENSTWLMQIINDILDITKIESGKMDIEKIPFDLQKLFSSCRNAILPKAMEKNLTLHFYSEPLTGKMPLGDPAKLRQVLLNLLSNAVKFTESGIIKLMCDAVKQDETSVTMRFDIKDSGIGISPAQMEKIFIPFMQAETSTTRKYGGTGLGLSITKNMVEMMGGKLEAQSTPGVGSNFGFTLTFETMHINSDEVLEAHGHFDEMKKPTFAGEILLCEDNSMNQQVICEHLERVGITAVIAENGKIGVEKFKERLDNNKKQFDLVFMDIHMPVMDGLEATEQILELNTGVPIVALTANVMPEDRNLYKTKGMSECLGKPFTAQELWKCLTHFFVPLHWQEEDKETQMNEQNELQQRLSANFVKNNKDKFEEIVTAIKNNDIIVAHRLAHTLKGNAGQLNKSLLQRAAQAVEHSLKEGKNRVTQTQLGTLEIELAAVLDELSPLLQTKTRENAEYIDSEAALHILDNLVPLINDNDPEALQFLTELHKIKGSDELVLSLEDFDFKKAAEALATLRGIL